MGANSPGWREGDFTVANVAPGREGRLTWFAHGCTDLVLPGVPERGAPDEEALLNQMRRGSRRARLESGNDAFRRGAREKNREAPKDGGLTILGRESPHGAAIAPAGRGF